ncbi:MAG TPA: A/G-specific adenine glycosylase [Arachidicoccus sp.]|nr:A/G-specific adenine glycosylase [Arachidicoccus sp.]
MAALTGNKSSHTQHQQFAKRLLQWHKTANHRLMPWKGEKDPYKIWLSEIILQQTRVEQGLAYYEKFTKHYPTVRDLAAAGDNQVFKDWEGLGYYNRCRNLLHTARYIASELKGAFPASYEGLLQLKGIGPYTAAAISAFAFNLPFAVVDGNVFRVLSRIYGIADPIDSAKGKTLFNELADANLDKKSPALYNQAIMDFGATMCKPAVPKCGSCPMQNICLAYTTGVVNQLPVKEKILQKKLRYFTWLLLEADEKIFVHKRLPGDIWADLHEFYLIETVAKPDWDTEEIRLLLDQQLKAEVQSISALKPSTQQLTHQKIMGYFFHVKLRFIPQALAGQHWLKKSAIGRLAFPKMLKDMEF